MCMEEGGEKSVSKCPVFLVLNFHLPYVPYFSDWAVVLMWNIYQELTVARHNSALQASRSQLSYPWKIQPEHTGWDIQVEKKTKDHTNSQVFIVIASSRTSHNAEKLQDLGQHSLKTAFNWLWKHWKKGPTYKRTHSLWDELFNWVQA